MWELCTRCITSVNQACLSNLDAFVCTFGNKPSRATNPNFCFVFWRLAHSHGIYRVQMQGTGSIGSKKLYSTEGIEL